MIHLHHDARAVARYLEPQLEISQDISPLATCMCPVFIVCVGLNMAVLGESWSLPPAYLVTFQRKKAGVAPCLRNSLSAHEFTQQFMIALGWLLQRYFRDDMPISLESFLSLIQLVTGISARPKFKYLLQSSSMLFQSYTSSVPFKGIQIQVPVNDMSNIILSCSVALKKTKLQPQVTCLGVLKSLTRL